MPDTQTPADAARQLLYSNPDCGYRYEEVACMSDEDAVLTAIARGLMEEE